MREHVSDANKVIQFYQEIFKSTNVKVFSEVNQDYFSNHWLTCILVDEKQTGFKLAEKLNEILTIKIKYDLRAQQIKIAQI